MDEPASTILDSISAFGGVKRKKMPQKFYTVRVGLKPGIYYSWDECLAQVKGQKGAIFKSFTTLTEAQKFLTSSDTSRSIATAGKNRPTKYYGVQSGHVPGVYTDWSTAESQIRGWKAPRFKAFPTYAEAQAFVALATPRPAPNAQPSPSPAPARPSAEDDATPPSAKRRKKAASSTPIPEPALDREPGDDDLPPGAEDGFDPRITLNPQTGQVEYKTDAHLQQTRWQAMNQPDNTPLKIYTDGSALGNGALGAVAGVGVYFGPQHPKNLSEPLTGARQTNQRAELTAVQRALELSPRNRPLQIYTDSNYAIKCVTEWFIKWRQNGWLNSAKKPVENKDLVEKILNLLEERHRIGGSRSRVEFIWVKGHASDVGNNAADELAVAGAREAKELIASGVMSATDAGDS